MADTVIVAMSGGVDSSVAACLLAEGAARPADLKVAGASQDIWPPGHAKGHALSDAADVCRILGVPYLTVNLYREFREIIVSDFLATYVAGKTPNPCVLCNRRIKFGLFFKRARERLLETGYIAPGSRVYFATGHYVRMERGQGGAFLKKARDPFKDQSYMLYRLPGSVLDDLIFPLGDMKKTEVIDLAEKRDLSNARRKESQDACFIDEGYADYLMRAAGDEALRQPGDIVDRKGCVLGRHRGYIHYTVGQRKGLGLGNGPWYVSALDSQKNRVEVCRREDVLRRTFRVADLNLFCALPVQPLRCHVKVRYQAGELPCRVHVDSAFEVRAQPPEGAGANHSASVTVELDRGAVVTPGQSAVFYADDLVLGGGIIQ